MTTSSLHHLSSSKIHWKIRVYLCRSPILQVECSHLYPPLPLFRTEMLELCWRATRLIPTILLSMLVFFLLTWNAYIRHMLESPLTSSRQCPFLRSTGESIFLRRYRGSMGYWPIAARLYQCHCTSNRWTWSVARFITHDGSIRYWWCWMLPLYAHLTSNNLRFENYQSRCS